MPPRKLHKYKDKLVTIEYLACVAKVTTACIGQWIRTGLTAEEAVDKIRKGVKLKTVPYLDGRETIVRLSEIAGCTLSAMHQRLIRHTAEEAVAMGPGEHRRGVWPRAKKLISWNGGEYTYSELAGVHPKGYTEGTIKFRICYMGVDRAMTDEPTVQAPPPPARDKVKVKSRPTAEWEALGRARI